MAQSIRGLVRTFLAAGTINMGCMSVPEVPTEDLLREAVMAVRSLTRFEPELALILGSGLGPLAGEIETEAVLSYRDIPGMQESTAPGHAGELHLGTLAGRRVVAMKGRMHFYDGVSAAQTAFPVRLLHALGARSLLVSNACGSLNPNWRAGDLMLQLDYINFMADNPLKGPVAGGERFPVMFDCYDPAYQEIARQQARRLDLILREGVYLAISGPTYSTRAESRMFRSWGADVVGMSTVFEVMMARQLDMRVLGLSCITDMALADGNSHTTGDEVVRMAELQGGVFRELVTACLAHM